MSGDVAGENTVQTTQTVETLTIQAGWAMVVSLFLTHPWQPAEEGIQEREEGNGGAFGRLWQWPRWKRMMD